MSPLRWDSYNDWILVRTVSYLDFLTRQRIPMCALWTTVVVFALQECNEQVQASMEHIIVTSLWERCHFTFWYLLKAFFWFFSRTIPYHNVKDIAAFVDQQMPDLVPLALWPPKSPDFNHVWLHHVKCAYKYFVQLWWIDGPRVWIRGQIATNYTYTLYLSHNYIYRAQACRL